MQTLFPSPSFSISTCSRSIFRRLASAFSFLLAAFCLLLSPQAHAVEITSAGPLTTVGITADGNLYAYHTEFTHELYYSDPVLYPGQNPAAMWGIYDVDNDLLYGPATVAAGGTNHGNSGMTDAAVYTPWTAVSQTPVTGTGTAADPFTITSTMTGGALTAVVTATYEVGREFFFTSLSVTDTSGAARNLRVFLAADLYYGNDDRGTSLYDAGTGSVGGRVPADCSASSVAPCASGTPNPHAGFTGWLVPVTPASQYFAGHFHTMWAQIGTQHQLDNTVSVIEDDYAAALQWNRALPANGSVTIDAEQLFSGEILLLPLNAANGEVGTPYSQGFTPSGGGSVPPYTVEYLSGDFPPGLTYDPATFVLSGTPTVAGTYSFVLRVTDSFPGTPLVRDFPYTVVITQPPPPNPPRLPGEPIPVFGVGALVALTLALGIAAFGAASRGRRRR